MALDMFLENLYAFIRKAKNGNYKVNYPGNLPKNLLPDPVIIKTKNVLEAQFSPRKFTYRETKELLQETYPEYFVKIPSWYSKKWL